MSLHGSVNHTLWRPYNNQEVQFRHAFSDMFVATYRFLNSSIGASMGIVRRACNFNNMASDCDYNYRKLSPPPGNNAWALFEFTSASPPFWLLLQQSDVSNNATFGIGAGEPADNDWSSKISGFAVSFAVREDGLSPWGGTTANNGTDTKSRPVWTAGPSRLAMFPISNGPRGQWRVARSGLHPISLWIDIDNTKSRATFFHFLANEDSVTFLMGHDGGCNYDVTYMGRYNATNPTSPNSATYAFFSAITDTLGYSNTDFDDIIYPWHGGGDIFGRRHYGSNNIGMTYAGGNSTTGNDYYWTGGIIDRQRFTSVPIGLGLPIGMMYYTEFNRRLAFNQASKKVDVFNIPIYVDGLNRGYVGELSNLKICHTFANHSTINNRKFAAFGRRKNELKIMSQWGANIAPGKFTTVFGEQF